MGNRMKNCFDKYLVFVTFCSIHDSVESKFASYYILDVGEIKLGARNLTVMYIVLHPHASLPISQFRAPKNL